MSDLLNDNESLEKFLKNVDEIESIVKTLNSTNSNEVAKSIQKADELIDYLKKNNDDGIECEGIRTKTVTNRTIINKDSASTSLRHQNELQNQEALVKVLEKDAEERYKRRVHNKKLSDNLKNLGNIEFSNGNYEKAIDFYSQALEKLKDNLPVYTNRAQSYLKIGKYNEAILDCDWALRIDEKCIKAYIHKGRAYTYLKEFDKSLKEFDKAKQIDPKQISIIDEYIKEVVRCRDANEKEKNLENFPNDSKDKDDVSKIIENLYKTNQHLLYYNGALNALASCLTNDNQRTLFRVKNGFEMFTMHPRISEWLFKKKYDKLDKYESNVVHGVILLLKSSCKDCDENIKCLFNIKDITLIFDAILSTNQNLMVNVQLELLELLFELSISDYGINMLLKNMDTVNLMNKVIDFIDRHESLKAVQFIQNLSAQKKFLNKLQLSTQAINQYLNKIMTLFNKNLYHELTLTLLLTLNNMLTSEIIKNEALINASLWICLENLFDKHEIYSNVLLSAFINMCAKKSNILNERGRQLVRKAYVQIDSNEEKSLMLIGNIIQNCVDSQKELNMSEVLTRLIQNIKNQSFVKLSIKILALYTEREVDARKMLIQMEKNVQFLYNLFEDCSKNESEVNKNLHDNETLINNCCLCLSHLVDYDNSTADYFTQTNIIMDLLYLTRDMYKNEVQKTCGILIAKLVKQNKKHLQRLRELHGIEILHQSLKFIDF